MLPAIVDIRLTNALEWQPIQNLLQALIDGLVFALMNRCRSGEFEQSLLKMGDVGFR